MSVGAHKIDPTQIEYAEVPFQSGAMCFAFTDGALKGQNSSVQLLAGKIQSLLKAGKSMEEIVGTLMAEGEGRDDCLIIGFAA